MESSEENKNFINFKSEILLPVIFILTTVLAVLFAASSDFKEDLESFVVYFYFGVVILYIGIAIFDLKKGNNKNNKKKTFVFIMSILTLISAILYLVFYLIF